MPSSWEPWRKILVRRNQPARASRGDDGVEEQLVLPGSASWLQGGGWLAGCHCLKMDVEVCV